MVIDDLIIQVLGFKDLGKQLNAINLTISRLSSNFDRKRGSRFYQINKAHCTVMLVLQKASLFALKISHKILIKFSQLRSFKYSCEGNLQMVTDTCRICFSFDQSIRPTFLISVASIDKLVTFTALLIIMIGS